MVILAEIADKMPSTAGIVIACLIAAGFAIVLAWVHRAVAWTVLLFTLVVGGFFAAGGYYESFIEGSFSDAVWSDLVGRGSLRALPALCCRPWALPRFCFSGVGSRKAAASQSTANRGRDNPPMQRTGGPHVTLPVRSTVKQRRDGANRAAP